MFGINSKDLLLLENMLNDAFDIVQGSRNTYRYEGSLFSYKKMQKINGLIKHRISLMTNTKQKDMLAMGELILSLDRMKSGVFNPSKIEAHGFEVIASKIEQTTMLVQDVSNASREQMQGIGQINTAITQLDQMTQENAKVAAQADSIADATINKASAMVDDASSKEFVGKEKIKATQTKTEVIEHNTFGVDGVNL